MESISTLYKSGHTGAGSRVQGGIKAKLSRTGFGRWHNLGLEHAGKLLSLSAGCWRKRLFLASSTWVCRGCQGVTSGQPPSPQQALLATVVHARQPLRLLTAEGLGCHVLLSLAHATNGSEG